MALQVRLSRWDSPMHRRRLRPNRNLRIQIRLKPYQICKMVGEMSAVLCGKVDGILLTGGLVRFKDIVDGIKTRCGFIAPIEVYPGEMEQEALALPALKVLRGELAAQTYSGRNVWQGFGDIGL